MQIHLQQHQQQIISATALARYRDTNTASYYLSEKFTLAQRIHTALFAAKKE